jgi:hypothetical protein
MKTIAFGLASVFVIISNLCGQWLPYGQEFLINTYETGYQSYPTIAGLSDGGFVVCWDGPVPGGSGNSIYGQIFDSYCAKRGNEFHINTNGNKSQQLPSLAGLTNGGFVACWESMNLDQGSKDIVGQVFNATGVKQGAEFQITEDVGIFQAYPSITGLKNGRLVLCWQRLKQDSSRWDIFGQIFEASGTKKGNEFQVFGTIEGAEYNPSVAALKSGGFVVCWESQRSSGSWSEICGQVLEFDGTKKGNNFLINTYAEGIQAWPSVAGLPDGRFVVCWADFERGIFCQIFDSNGAKLGYEFQANTFPFQQGAQNVPSVAALTDCRFVICWVSDKQDNDGYGIIGKYFLAEPIIHFLKEFSLIAPANDQTIDVMHPTFQWQQPSFIQECYPWEITFNLYIETDINFSNPQIIRDIQDTTYTIDSLAAGQTYFWKVLAKNLAGDSLWSTQQDWGFFIKQGATLVENANNEMPQSFELFQNYPNPFNSSTEIRYCLPNGKENYQVQLKVYDVLGRLVNVLVDQKQSIGSYAVSWDGTDLRGNRVVSGVYFYSLETGDLKSIRKMLVLQ